MVFTCSDFPRSAKYDPDWIIENAMGPNVLWLTESLAQVMDLKPGMRVLDMGCGKAISSIFLAKEFDLQVWAADLWIPPGENWQRIRQAGLEDKVFPIHAEAHALPFADQFFDAILSMDAYHYFGTDDLYLGSHMVQLVKPGGQIGIIVPGLVQEWPASGDVGKATVQSRAFNKSGNMAHSNVPEEIPEHLKPYWEFEMNCLHSPDWWRRHWERSGLLTVELSDMMPNGWKHWLTSASILAQRGSEPGYEEEAEMLRLDDGMNLGFTRMVARRNGPLQQPS